MSVFQTAASTWETMKPRAMALAIGLIAGPLITNYVGWQVTSSASQGAVRSAVIEQQALICEERARAEVKDTGKLEWGARSDLAKKWAVMPGVATADSDASSSCARKLASS